MKIIRLFILCSILSLLVLAFPVLAQDTDENIPLLDLLALVPDDINTMGGAPIFSYVDLDAIAAARGIARPTAEEMLNRTEESRVWIASINTMVSGPRWMIERGMLFEETKAAVGFNVTDIERALVFGDVPNDGAIYQSSTITPDTLTAPLEAQGYAATAFDGVPVWCAAAGCEEGLKMNLAANNPGHPFGGEFGRQEPVAVLDSGLMMSARTIPTMQSIIALTDGEGRHLANNEAVRAAVMAAAEIGSIRQMSFYSVREVGFITEPRVFDQLNPPVIDSSPPTPEPTIPVYGYVVIADVYDAETNEQVNFIGLLYPNSSAARSALPMVQERMSAYESWSKRRAFTELISERGGAFAEPYIYEDAVSGVAVAVFPFVSPQPDNTLVEDPLMPYVRPSSMIHHLLLQEIEYRSFSPLSVLP